MIININSIFAIYKNYVLKSILENLGIKQSLNSIADEDLINFLLGANNELKFENYKLKIQKNNSLEKNDSKLLFNKCDSNKYEEVTFDKFFKDDICVRKKISIKYLIDESENKLIFQDNNAIIYNFKTLKDNSIFYLKTEPL